MTKLKKLVLKKEFVSNLNSFEMNRLRGGAGYTDPYVNPVDNTYVKPPIYYPIPKPISDYESCTGDCTTSVFNCHSEGGCCRTNG